MTTIAKVAWGYNKDRKTLVVYPKGKDVFLNPGGKREGSETDAEALIREVREELSVDLVSETIKYLGTFTAQAYGKPEGTMVAIKCYMAGFIGELKASAEIERFDWVTSRDSHKTSPTGELILSFLKAKNLID